MNLDQAERFRLKKRIDGAQSDGCTFAPELGTPCCEMHDYLRRFKPDGMTAREADKLLRQCIAKKGHPVFSWIYWVFVRISNLFGIYS
jgi:hypothetical protein